MANFALSEAMIWWATGLSLVILIATLIALPWVVTRLPADYFSESRRSHWRAGDSNLAMELVIVLAKNLLGAILVMLGVVMLVTPGQGLLTLLIGLMLMNFPGKYRFERWLVLRPGVLRGLNWIRDRWHCPPLETPSSHNG